MHFPDQAPMFGGSSVLSPGSLALGLTPSPTKGAQGALHGGVSGIASLGQEFTGRDKELSPGRTTLLNRPGKSGTYGNNLLVSRESEDRPGPRSGSKGLNMQTPPGRAQHAHEDGLVPGGPSHITTPFATGKRLGGGARQGAASGAAPGTLVGSGMNPKQLEIGKRTSVSMDGLGRNARRRYGVGGNSKEREEEERGPGGALCSRKRFAREMDIVRQEGPSIRAQALLKNLEDPTDRTMRERELGLNKNKLGGRNSRGSMGPASRGSQSGGLPGSRGSQIGSRGGSRGSVGIRSRPSSAGSPSPRSPGKSPSGSPSHGGGPVNGSPERGPSPRSPRRSNSAGGIGFGTISPTQQRKHRETVLARVRHQAWEDTEPVHYVNPGTSLDSPRALLGLTDPWSARGKDYGRNASNYVPPDQEGAEAGGGGAGGPKYGKHLQPTDNPYSSRSLYSYRVGDKAPLAPTKEIFRLLGPLTGEKNQLRGQMKFLTDRLAQLHQAKKELSIHFAAEIWHREGEAESRGLLPVATGKAEGYKCLKLMMNEDFAKNSFNRLMERDEARDDAVGVQGSFFVTADNLEEFRDRKKTVLKAEVG